MTLSWCSFWRETEVNSRVVAAPGKDCSTTLHACLAKSDSLLPRGQLTEHGCRCSQSATFPSQPHQSLSDWLPPGKPLAFSESSLRDLMCLSRMIPAISQRVGGRHEGKVLRIVPYKGVDINLTHCFWRGWWDLELAAGTWQAQFARPLFRDEKKNVLFCFFFPRHIVTESPWNYGLLPWSHNAPRVGVGHQVQIRCLFLFSRASFEVW